MFGLLAFGFFAGLALSESSKNGGSGNSILGALGLASGAAAAGIGWMGSWAKKKIEEKKDKKEQDKEIKRLVRLKALNDLRKEVEKHKSDNSDEAKQLRENYNATLSCIYDENGNERSDEDIEKEYKKLPKSLKESVNKASKLKPDSKELKDIVEKFKKTPFSEDDLDITEQNIKGDIAKIEKNKALLKLEKEKNEKLDSAKDDEERKTIEKEFEKKKRQTSGFYNIKIKDAEDAINKINSQPSEKQEKTIKKEIEKLEKDKKELEQDKDNTKEVDKYLNFEFDSDIQPGDLTGEDEEKKKQAEEQLKKAGLDSEIYLKIESEKSKKSEDGKTPTAEDILKDNTELSDKLTEQKNKRIKEIDSQIQDKTAKINNEPEEPEKSSDEGEETDDEKEGDEGEETDDEKEGDERTDNDDDLEDDDEEKDEKTGEVTKSSTKDPKKVWKRRTYKRGNKTFKTKSYYNKKGNSISAKDFKEKVQNYEKKSKNNQNENSIIYFIKNKDIIVEQFKPTVGLIDYIHSKS